MTAGTAGQPGEQARRSRPPSAVPAGRPGASGPARGGGSPAAIGQRPRSDGAIAPAPDPVAFAHAGATDELPYGPFLQRTLPAIRRAFGVLNRVYVLPAIRLGLGPLHANPATGAWMLLRTTGNRTGLRREAVVGYVLLDGAAYCSAGFGVRTAWYRNLLAEPRVEIVLPAGGFAGVAEPVTDPAELERGWRALIGALGVLGRLFVCRPDAPAEVLAARTANLPLVRIRTTGLAPGPADPGGAAWVVPTALGLAWVGFRLRPRRRSRCR